MEKQGAIRDSYKSRIRASRLKVGRVGGSNPSSPTNQKSRTRGISRSCTLYILFTLRKLTNTTLDFLLMYLIDFANTIVNLRDFQIPADPGLLCIPRTLIIKKML